MASKFRVGQEIYVFYRFQQCQDVLFLPVANNGAGACSPRVGESDGWQKAVIKRIGSDYDGPPIKDVVFVEYQHSMWFDRRGRKIYRERDIDMFQEWVHISQIWDHKQKGPPPVPDLSFLVVRWGGEEDCDPVSEGNGGWGRTGSNVSDPYMAVFFEETVWPLLGPHYQVITVFISQTADLDRITPSMLIPMMKGAHKVSMWFLWPVTYQDAPLKQPGYVNNNALLDCMARVENCGVVTRFPHHSHFYKLLGSKAWMAHLSLMPHLNVPATTKVSVSLIHRDPRTAANTALSSLRNLQICKRRLNSAAAAKLPPVAEMKGVVKLGFSWEAWGVKLFSGEAELARQLASLAEQPLGLHDGVMVTEFVDFRVELRLFLVNPVVKWDADRNKPFPVRPAKILYTKFNTVDGEKMLTNFNRLQRHEAVHQCFNDDSQAMADAESKCAVLAARLLTWLQTESAETPPVMRMDFMVQRTAPGKASATTGELTELGACFLGWDEGPQTVWKAVLASCFRPGLSGRPAKRLPDKRVYPIWRRIGQPWPSSTYAQEGEANSAQDYAWHERQQHDSWRLERPKPPQHHHFDDSGGWNAEEPQQRQGGGVGGGQHPPPPQPSPPPEQQQQQQQQQKQKQLPQPSSQGGAGAGTAAKPAQQKHSYGEHSQKTDQQQSSEKWTKVEGGKSSPGKKKNKKEKRDKMRNNEMSKSKKNKKLKSDSPDSGD